MTAIAFAWRRLIARPLLSSLLVLGLGLAIALPVAIPIYADAATARVLSDQDFQDIGFRPAFAYLFWYASATEQPVGWEDVAPVDQYLRTDGLDNLGLPPQSTSAFVDTIRFGADQGEAVNPVTFRLASMSDVADRVRLVEGRLPSEEALVDGRIEAVVSDRTAGELEAEVGQVITLTDMRDPDDPDGVPGTVEVVVVGIWEPRDVDDPGWIISPDQLASRAFVSHAAITDAIDVQFEDAIGTAAWYTVLDTTSLSAGDVDAMIGAAARVSATAESMLPGLSLEIDPVTGLEQFRERSSSLNRRLNAYALPAVVLILVFVMLVVSLTTNDRRAELAVLRSRGASRPQLVGQVAVEAGILSAIALVIGLVGGLGIAALMGKTQTFMDLSGDSLAAVELSTPAWRAALVVGLVSVVLLVVPAIGVSKDTVVTYAETSARSTRRPWWQRTSLDLLIVVAVGVFAYQYLRAPPDLGTDALEDPFLVLFPALAALAVGLITVRLLPFVFELLARLLGSTSSVVALVASRRAARNPANTFVPLLLLVVTVSLAIFTSSLAKTLDLQLFDETYHRVGAQWSAIEFDSAAQPVVNGVEFPRVLAPIEEFESIPGVEAATRVGRFPGRVSRVGSSLTPVTVFGIDADAFTDVAFFRDEYSPEPSFPDNVARLAAIPQGVLVQSGSGFAVGDDLNVQIQYDGETLEQTMVVVGVVSLFPTWMPSDDPFVIVNLDTVFAGTGEEGQYHVWMTTDDGEPPSHLETDIELLESVSADAAIGLILTQPERQGVFGVLTVGFIASILISILGFFFATLFKVRGSAVELGALQAMGMSPRRVAAIVVAELALVMGGGLVAGVATGWGLSRRLIVRLVGDSGLTAVPELLAETDRVAVFAIVGLILALFVISAFVLVSVLRRMKLFEALKLGEAP